MKEQAMKHAATTVLGIILLAGAGAGACSSSPGSSSRASGGAESGGTGPAGGAGGSGGVHSATGGASSGGSAGGGAGGTVATGGTKTATGGATTGNGGRTAAGGATATATTTARIASGGSAAGGASAGGGTTSVRGGAGGSTLPGTGGRIGSGGTVAVGTGGSNATFSETPKPRVLVLTDISNEPDDEESLVRFLVYANEYDVEGLVATTSTWLKSGPREDIIRTEIDAYEKVRANLSVHAGGYPTADQLRSVTATGQTSYGMAAVGSGNATAGSKLIIAATDKADARPLWITGWGGMNTLAQALSDVRSSRTSAEVDAFVTKLRVYATSDQDDTGGWLRSQFPKLFYVVSPSDQTSNDYARSTWSGISGDDHYKNGPGYCMDLVSNAWLSTNVRTGHGALGAVYPEWKYIMEGDTPTFLGLVDNGLGASVSPSYGGWGGRYALAKPAGESREIWTNSSDTFEYKAGSTNTSNQATIWRWRPDYQYDFAARMDWCVADTRAKANHNPIPLLNGDESKAVMTTSARAGATLALSADGTRDPDGDTVTVRWFIYPEAGTLGTGAKLSATDGLATTVALPPSAAGTLHVILVAQDDGSPQLSAYRRAIIDVGP